MKLTHSSVAVAQALLRRPRERRWGYDLSRETGVRSGVLYPILGRMLDEGWLDDGWEDMADARGKHPPRRYYTVTDEGLRQLSGMVGAAASDLRFARPTALGTQGGSMAEIRPRSPAAADCQTVVLECDGKGQTPVCLRGDDQCH
ncbi:MAG: PadR family transcriptional regulator [Propionibacteriaceae bacterium]|jgi:PadR family transcriptional regulator PadR|nr:PadR family transcriptional regulator [Propionibacteriaceae bacterium]